jgi:hypothetical protein
MGCLRGIVAALVVMGSAAVARAQLAPGQIDTFEDGTTQGWTAGGPLGVPPSPPTNIATGGPAGSGDHFLRITASGVGGPGSRLSAFNLSQWAGDYIAAGISGIRMDVRNFGPDDAFLRLLFADPAGGPPTNMAITDAVFVPGGGNWTSIDFDVTASSLTAILGNQATALTNATELRILHNPSPTFPAPPTVTLTLGVDNIQAVPESSSARLIGVGMLLLIGIAKKSRGTRGQRRHASAGG